MLTFSKKSVLINANWFKQDKINYIKEGGEKLLATYLNLHRFIRYDQTSFQSELIYLTSINQLYAAINEHKRLMDMSDVFSMLKKLGRMSIIEVVSHRTFLRTSNKAMPSKDLLIIKDLDYMNCQYYVEVPLDVVEYMLQEGLTYRHIALYLMMTKWANNGESKCYVAVNKLAEWLGYSNKSILKYIADMNKLGVLASTLRKPDRGRVRYEHYMLKSMDQYDEFVDAYKLDMQQFE